jgi:hypothetical protein
MVWLQESGPPTAHPASVWLEQLSWRADRAHEFGIAGHLEEVVEAGEQLAEDGATSRIREMDPAQVPGGHAHTDPGEVAVAGGDFKADALQTDGAIAPTLGAALQNRM